MLTMQQAKHLYVVCGGPSDHSSSEWENILLEMNAVVSARSDRAAGKVIEWWGCWDRHESATAWAKRARAAWRDMQSNANRG